jgi:hypothetical protein
MVLQFSLPSGSASNCDITAAMYDLRTSKLSSLINSFLSAPFRRTLIVNASTGYDCSNRSAQHYQVNKPLMSVEQANLQSLTVGT